MTWRVKYGGNKYKARSTVYNGSQYHSLFEAGYAQGLDMRKKAGDIQGWERQKRFSLYGKNGSHICDYILDFVVTNSDGSISYIEVKGFETDTWRLKWKLFLDNYGNDPAVTCEVVR